MPTPSEAPDNVLINKAAIDAHNTWWRPGVWAHHTCVRVLSSPRPV